MIVVKDVSYKLINTNETYSIELKLHSDDVDEIREFILKEFGQKVLDMFGFKSQSLYFQLHETIDNLRMIIDNLENNNIQCFLLHLDSEYKSVRVFSEYLIKYFDINHSTIRRLDE